MESSPFFLGSGWLDPNLPLLLSLTLLCAFCVVEEIPQYTNPTNNNNNNNNNTNNKSTVMVAEVVSSTPLKMSSNGETEETGLVKEIVEDLETLETPEKVKKARPPKEADEVEEDEDDLTNTATIIHKIKEVTDTYSSIRGWDKELPAYKMYFYFLCLVQLRKRLRAEEPALYDFIFQIEGDSVTPKDLRNLEYYLELTEMSREASTQVLEDKLKTYGYTLFRHDKDADRVAHYIAIDKKRKEVVIAIPRQTPLKDVLFDTVSKARFLQLSETKKLRCHAELLDKAEIMLQQIQPLMEDFFLPLGYNVKICGHSLGGGVAALLGILLKHHMPLLRLPISQNRLKVLTYGCPPVVNMMAANRAANYITSVVNNHDIVPRIAAPSIRAMHKIFHQMENKLSAKGLVPTDWKSAKANLEKIRARKKPILTPIELQVFAEQLFETEKATWKEEMALKVPGRVIIMWNVSLVTENKTLDAMCGLGTMRSLHLIEIDDDMIYDHTPEAYLKSIRELVDEMNRRYKGPNALMNKIFEIMQKK